MYSRPDLEDTYNLVHEDTWKAVQKRLAASRITTLCRDALNLHTDIDVRNGASAAAMSQYTRLRVPCASSVITADGSSLWIPS